MIKWIWTLLQKIWHWGMHDRPKLARRVPGDEGPFEVPDRLTAKWSKESGSKLDDGSNAQRLEEKERDQRSRTSRLSEQFAGVLSTTEGSGDLDYTMKEHFFSPQNPNNK
jgi:hypothetical protein